MIPVERLSGFMRLLWFACHGNVFVRHVDILEPLEDANTVSDVTRAVQLNSVPLISCKPCNSIFVEGESSAQGRVYGFLPRRNAKNKD